MKCPQKRHEYVAQHAQVTGIYPTPFPSAVSTGVKREINWIHMPMPRNRTDDAYFAPLRACNCILRRSCIWVWCLSPIASAQQAVADFRVATECGMGRRNPETIRELLRIHSEVAAPVQEH